MLIFAAIVAIFIYGMIAAMLGATLPDLSDRFHLTPSQNGTIAFAQALGLVVASLAVGPLLDNEGEGRSHPRPRIHLHRAFRPTPLGPLPHHCLLLFLLGVGGGIVVTGANALVSDVGEAHRATALNLVNLFFGLGGLATPFISANVLSRDWVRLCYTVAFLTVIALGIQATTGIAASTGAAAVLADSRPVLGARCSSFSASFCFLRLLRGWCLGLAHTPPDRPGRSGITCAEHPLARLRAWPADRPARRLANSHPRVSHHSHPRRLTRHGNYDISDAPHQ